MANSSSSSGPQMINFLENHIPSVPDGLFTIEVDHEVSTGGVTLDTFKDTKTIAVSGPRFQLDANVIGTIFPADNSHGDYQNVNASITINRSTLPWERSPLKLLPNEKNPWLALLLFDESELDMVSSVYTDTAENVSKNIGLTDDPVIDPQEEVRLVDVDMSILSNVAPTLDGLRLLSHVRFTDNLEQAVVMCNRLPKPGSTSTVFLVSMEDRYSIGTSSQKGYFDVNIGPGRKPGTNALVLLKKWSFTCPDDTPYSVTPFTQAKLAKKGIPQDALDRLGNLSGMDYRDTTSFKDALTEIGIIETTSNSSTTADGTIALPPTQYEDILQICQLPPANFYDLLHTINHIPGTFGMGQSDASSINPEVATLISKGSLPMKHYMREGARTVSFYRGPFVRGEDKTELELPVMAADELLLYYEDIGMFDTSYSAAWTLGRQLAMADKKFSVALYQYKKKYILQQKQAEQQATNPLDSMLGQLYQISPPTQPIVVPDIIRNFFEDLRLLRRIPYHYLVPSAEYLPMESIRFFQVDSLWIQCLMDGAFSVGRVTPDDKDSEQEIFGTIVSPQDAVVDTSGFLLRSEVVSGWPSLMVDGYNQIFNITDIIDDAFLLPSLRMDFLGKGTLIQLFSGTARTVDVHQHPEALHSGVDWDPERTGSSSAASGSPSYNPNYYKELRKPDGQTYDNVYVEVPFSDVGRLVVDIETLAQSIKARLGAATFTSAEFAMQMIESVTKVRYTLEPSSSSSN